MPTLRLEGDSQGAVKAIADLTKALDKTGKQFDQTVAKAKELERAATKIVRDNEGPQERYNRKIDELAKLVTKGKLTFEEASKAAKRYGSELENAGKKGQGAFGQTIQSQILSMAAGIGSASAIAATLSRAFQDIEANAQSAADAVLNGLGAYGELQQVATSPEDFAKLVGQARGFERSGIFKAGTGQGADLAFALRNAGYSDEDVGLITRLGTSAKVRPENMQKVAEGLKKYQDIFGQGETGSINDIAQRVFQAAGETQADFASVAQAATLYGSEASQLGVSDEEALAAFVAVEKSSPGVEEAATRLRSFFNQVYKEGLGKGTLKETIQSIKARTDAGENAFDILQETRAVAGFNILSKSSDVYDRQLAGITGVQGQDLIGGRSFLDTDTKLSAAKARREAEGALKGVEEDRYAVQESLFGALRAERMKRYESQGYNPLDIWLANKVEGARDVLGLENMNLRVAAENERDSTSPELLRRIDAHLESLDNKTRPMPAPGGPQE